MSQDPNQPTPEELALFRLIADFVNAPNWAESRRLYDENDALHGDEALLALEGMMEGARQQGDAQKLRILAIHRDLLRSVRELGADTAFERIEAGPDPDLLNVIAAFINAQDWDESRRILDENPQLLDMNTQAAFEMLIQTAAATQDDRRTHLLQTHADLLDRVREVGADVAFAELTQAFPEERMQTIAQFVYAGSTGASRAVLEAHPELLDEQTAAIFQRLIRDAQREGETQLALLLTLHRDILRKAKAEGIDAAFTEDLDLLPDEGIMQAVVDFVNAEGVEESRAVLEAHPELIERVQEADEAFNVLIQTAETQQRGDMVQHLSTYRDLLKVVREIGIEGAFHHVASPEMLLDLIVQTSLDALRANNPELTTAWRQQLGQFSEQAATLGDENMVKLTNAIARLFLGGKPEKLDPGLAGKHGEAWAQIAEAATK